mgnify:CR=1 FL=1
MTIKIKNKTTKKINNNTIITYTLLINNKYNLRTLKVYKNNKFSHYCLNDNDHNILLDNNITINKEVFNNKIINIIN